MKGILKIFLLLFLLAPVGGQCGDFGSRRHGLFFFGGGLFSHHLPVDFQAGVYPLDFVRLTIGTGLAITPPILTLPITTSLKVFVPGWQLSPVLGMTHASLLKLDSSISAWTAGLSFISKRFAFFELGITRGFQHSNTADDGMHPYLIIGLIPPWPYENNSRNDVRNYDRK